MTPHFWHENPLFKLAANNERIVITRLEDVKIQSALYHTFNGTPMIRTADSLQHHINGFPFFCVLSPHNQKHKGLSHRAAEGGYLDVRSPQELANDEFGVKLSVEEKAYESSDAILIVFLCIVLTLEFSLSFLSLLSKSRNSVVKSFIRRNLCCKPRLKIIFCCLNIFRRDKKKVQKL